MNGGRSYFLGGTWPTLTRTQMILRVCIPTEQETSSPRARATDALADGTDESSMHCPHGPVCQWYTVQGWSLQVLVSWRALTLGHWTPPEGQRDRSGQMVCIVPRSFIQHQDARQINQSVLKTKAVLLLAASLQ